MLRCAGFDRVEGDWLHQVNAHHGQANGARFALFLLDERGVNWIIHSGLNVFQLK